MSAERASSEPNGTADRAAAALVVLVGLLIAAILVVAVVKTWPILHPAVLETAVADPDCSLRSGPCGAHFAAGGAVRFSITPPTIPVVAPLRLRVEIEGLDVDGVEVDFVGVDMNMGYNRVGLDASGRGLYEGQGTLPVCVRTRMDWEARVLIRTPEGLLAAPFRFSTVRD